MFYESHNSLSCDFINGSGKPLTDFHFPLHMHKSFEIMQVVEGMLTITVGRSSYDVEEGYSVLILPGEPHAYYTKEHSVVQLCVFSTNYLPDTDSLLHSKKQYCPVFKFDRKHFIEDLVENKEKNFKTKSLLYEMLAKYVEGEQCERSGFEEESLVCNIMNYVDKHCTEHLTLQTLSKKFGYNYRYLSGVINNFFHDSFPTIINEYRVSYACKLLKDYSYSITEIGEMSGFESLRSFNRNFKNVTEMSPKEYREKYFTKK